MYIDVSLFRAALHGKNLNELHESHEKVQEALLIRSRGPRWDETYVPGKMGKKNFFG